MFPVQRRQRGTGPGAQAPQESQVSGGLSTWPLPEKSWEETRAGEPQQQREADEGPARSQRALTLGFLLHPANP